jgi:hypothetical protein
VPRGRFVCISTGIDIDLLLLFAKYKTLATEE